MSKLIHGVGISEDGEFKRYNRVGGKYVGTREYKLWVSMLQRCYSDECQKKHPTYVGCTVSEDFKYFQKFAKWCQSQVGFGLEGYHIDKDVLFLGNKIYSEDSCVFVPSNINALLTKREAQRGEFPVGVSWIKNAQKYLARCSDGSGKQKRLGRFTTPEEAFVTYKTFKEALIKQLANKYQSVIDTRVYEALMAYTVSIND